MSSQFADYSRQITSLTSSIQSYLASPLSSRPITSLITSKSELDECYAILEAMKVAAEGSGSVSNKKALVGKVARLKKEVRVSLWGKRVSTDLARTLNDFLTLAGRSSTR